MRKPISFKILTINSIFSVLLLTVCACSKKQVEESQFDSITPIGIVNEEVFYVQPIADAAVPFYLHEQSDFNKACRVVKSEADITKRDIYCILDMQELDLYHGTLKINFNAPAGYCSYLRVAPYWFWDYPPPPSVLALTATIKDQKVITSNTAGHGTLGGDGIFNCKYDYTKQGGPNCCEGTLSLTIQETDEKGEVNESFQVLDLAGKVGNCISGPGKDFVVDEKTKWPGVFDHQTSLVGVNDVLELKKLNYSGVGRIYNTYRANYFDPTINFPAALASYPLGISGPLGAVDGKPVWPNRPYYEFGCLDRSEDYIARIRLLIRSWDSLAEFTDKNNPYPNRNDPDEPSYGTPWHDRNNWKDLQQRAGSAKYPWGN